jgi:hypothetical protein
MRTKKSDTERDEAIAQLREWLPPGSTVYCVLRHVSRSGMQREISLHSVDSGNGKRADISWLSGLAARALGMRLGKRDGIIVGGCGMDMGFHLVYELSHTLHPSGFGCVGERCPSNDHSNGDRDYTPHGAFRPDLAGKLPSGLYDPESQSHKHWHNESGYALRHQWI